MSYPVLNKEEFLAILDSGTPVALGYISYHTPDLAVLMKAYAATLLENSESLLADFAAAYGPEEGVRKVNAILNSQNFGSPLEIRDIKQEIELMRDWKEMAFQAAINPHTCFIEVEGRKYSVRDHAPHMAGPDLG